MWYPLNLLLNGFNFLYFSWLLYTWNILSLICVLGSSFLICQKISKVACIPVYNHFNWKNFRAIIWCQHPWHSIPICYYIYIFENRRIRYCLYGIFLHIIGHGMNEMQFRDRKIVFLMVRDTIIDRSCVKRYVQAAFTYNSCKENLLYLN